jgi:hypothetical protein
LWLAFIGYQLYLFPGVLTPVAAASPGHLKASHTTRQEAPGVVCSGQRVDPEPITIRPGDRPDRDASFGSYVVIR